MTNRTPSFTRDLMASLVVFLVALPLCLGIAIASGAPPAAGLVTGIVGGLLVGMLQGSTLQVSGPAAGLAVIVYQLIQEYGFQGLSVIVILAGLMQVGAGLLKGGRWFRAVPPSVVSGMMAGIGVLILASQFHVMVDDKPKSNGLANLETIPVSIMKGITPSDLPHEEAAMIGLLSFGVLLLWGKMPRRVRAVPAPLAAAIVGSVVANVAQFPIAFVSVPDSFFSTLTFPTPASLLPYLQQTSIWIAAVGMAAVASAESLLSASAVDSLHQGPRANYDRELLAQGIGNTLCGFLGGLPMTGVIVRSSVNVEAGATTRRSTILHGAWLLLLVWLCPAVLRVVPISCLAAILVYTGMKLAHPSVARRLSRYGRSEVVIYFVTMIAIVVTDLLHGVMLGLGVACCYLLYRLSHLEIRIDDDPEQQRATVHVQGAATFLRLPDMAEALESVPAGREVHVRLEKVEHLDHAMLELLKSYDRLYEMRGGNLVVDWDRFDVGAPKRREVATHH